MEKFTKEEMEFLGQFEHNFSCAIDSDYVRGVALSELEKMRTIWAHKCSMRSDCGAGSASGDWRGAGVVPKAGFGCSELCERKTKTER